ncbi:protein SERAC1 [Condylostylus longicornis]|uniref:protein SERAC1 n=1 Tax=Condylostylus longicornis TaxID=2530218 RepID=UPI00244DD58D|nr:protein SERAC1 [Condylostylus longicornis]
MSSGVYNLQRYRKVVGGAGILTACALLYLEKRRIEKYFNGLVDTRVLDIDKKRPDYIYIKYHIYRESMRKLKRQQEQNANWINVIIHPIGKWWKTFKHSVAWRLLNIAQNGNQFERMKAVHQLAMIDHLKDWDFRHLAQICDARTAVSLARSGCDKRWFVPVPMAGVIKNPKIVLSDLHKMLEDMKSNSCVQHFLKKYFPVQDNIKDADMDEFISQGSFISTPDCDLLKECIAFLHHLTKDEKMCERLIKDGALILLLELKKIFEKDYETLNTLCKVMANLSMADDCVNDFFQSGWVTVLAEWREHPDMRLQVIAAKALANLDYDDVNHEKYPPNVYPLYPRTRQLTKPKADIIFTHGLLGGVFITWRQKDKKPAELNLYGKNAFYTSESDDVFLVGENKRVNGLKSKTEEKVKGNILLNEAPILTSNSNIKSPKRQKRQLPDISDAATKELVEELQTEAELENDWEVVYPDVPLKSNEKCAGEFSVTGANWVNDDESEDYTHCWPMDWLPEDFPNVRILGIDYTSIVTEWSAHYSKYCPCEKGQGRIDERSTLLLKRLARSNIGKDRPIVWVGHSMGGILTKNILLKSLEHSEESFRRVAKSTKGIVFLGTPHRGSPLAKWKQTIQPLIAPSIEVKEMEENNPKLLAMHNRFMGALNTQLKDVNVVSIVEGTPTMFSSFKFPLTIVTEESAHMSVGDFYVLQYDHLSLSKPVFRQSFLYQRLLQVIDETVNEKPKGNSTNVHKHSTQLDDQKSNFAINFLKEKTNEILNLFPNVFYKFITLVEMQEYDD